MKEFANKQKINWCPGCGNYVILTTVQRVLSELGIAKENIVFVSGIGCSSRFVYYMDTYGFHTIHGRATAVAAGLKIAHPELSVWVVIGDGDGLSIGLNHLLHLMRRNLKINILLLNNQIYGLTKGQFSPTSTTGLISNSSPYGNIDKPFNPMLLALAAECSFVARSIDADPKHLATMLTRAAAHQGTAFIEILQSCIVFNKNLLNYRNPEFRQEHCLYLQANTPISFGKNMEYGLQYRQQQLTIVNNIHDHNQNDLLIHQPTSDNNSHYALANLTVPEFPLVLGIFRNQEKPTYEATIAKRKQQIQAKYKRSLEEVFNNIEL